MSDLLIERVEGVPVAHAREDIDAANARQMHDELTECLQSGANKLVLDLSHIRYLDSAGIDMVFRLAERLQQRRARLLLVIEPDSQLRRLVVLVAMPSIVPVHDSVAEALGSNAGHRCI